MTTLRLKKDLGIFRSWMNRYNKGISVSRTQTVCLEQPLQTDDTTFLAMSYSKLFYSSRKNSADTFSHFTWAAILYSMKLRNGLKCHPWGYFPWSKNAIQVTWKWKAPEVLNWTMFHQTPQERLIQSHFSEEPIHNVIWSK